MRSSRQEGWLGRRSTSESNLSRYPVFLNHRTHRTHGNKSSRRYVIFPCIQCVLWFPALWRQELVAAPQYRAAANTAMGWKYANLLTELRIEN